MIEVKCLGCGQKLKVQDALAGKKARCPTCGDPVAIPSAGARTPSAVPAPALIPAPPPPAVRIPAPPPPAKPTAPDNPFGFTRPATTAEAPVGSFAGLARADTGEGMGERSGRKRRGRSSAARWATRLALAGALAGGLTIAIVRPTDAAMIRAIHEPLVRTFPTVSADAVRGVLVGTLSGLLLGCVALAVAGRSDEGAVGVFVLMIGGAVYGWFREASAQEMSWAFLLAGAACGVLVGAALGALLGAILAAIRG